MVIKLIEGLSKPERIPISETVPLGLTQAEDFSNVPAPPTSNTLSTPLPFVIFSTSSSQSG